MSPPGVRTIVLLILLGNAFGCARSKDVTHTREIQESGIIGECLMTRNDVSLNYVDGRFRRLAVGQPVVEQVPQIRSVGILPSGTHLRIEKVVRVVTYSDGFFSRFSKIVFARIESGQHTGRLVDIGWWALPSSAAEIESVHRLYERCPPDREP